MISCVYSCFLLILSWIVFIGNYILQVFNRIVQPMAEIRKDVSRNARQCCF